jgi:enolase-phosphatase E1
LSIAALPVPAALLIDIEGTVGSIRFVREVLFPYARERLCAFVNEHYERPDVAQALAAVKQETGAATLAEQIEVLERWSDADRKATPLKALQGMVWEAGYRNGALVAHLYSDAVMALGRWHARGVPVYVYSSGSVPAQRLYFAHTAAGDLTGHLSGYFDTTTGAKQEPASYEAIARSIGVEHRSRLFLSDLRAELTAAVSAGWHAVQVRRDGVPVDPFEPSVTSLEQLPF